MFMRKFYRAAVAGGILLGVYLGGNLYHPTVVCGESMSPALRDGRLIWVDRFYYRTHVPEPGDVIVFRMNDETYVKRVYRGPRQSLHYLSSKGSFLMPLRSAHVEEVRRRYARHQNCLRVHSVEVPDGVVFVLGDNYVSSIDSRHLGLIPLSAIVGRVRVAASVEALAHNEFVPFEAPVLRSRRRSTTVSDSSPSARIDPSVSLSRGAGSERSPVENAVQRLACPPVRQLALLAHDRVCP